MTTQVKKIGGVNVFGGGVALYNSDGKLLGAIGVSGMALKLLSAPSKNTVNAPCPNCG